MGYDNQPGDFTLPTKFTAKRAAEVARRKKIPTPSATPQEEKHTSIKKKQEIQHAEDVNTQVKSVSTKGMDSSVSDSKPRSDRTTKEEDKKETKKKEEKKAPSPL